MTYSKEEQLGRSPGGNRICKHGNRKELCSDYACRNSRNRLGGLKKQKRDGKQIAKALGKPAGLLSNEETTTWPIRWEEKSGKLALPVRRFYDLCKAQSDAATPIGSMYPFVAVAGDQTSGLAVIEISDLRNLLNEAKRGIL